MKKIALDTNIAVDILNGNTATIKQLKQFNVYYLPITVCGELLYGALNSKRKQANLKKFKAFIKSCKVLHSNALIAEEYAITRLRLKENGTPIPENDIWIAAICKVRNLPLATKDKHFKHVKGLKTISFA